MNLLALRLSIATAATLMALSASAQNLVTNGGFETGDVSGWRSSDPSAPVWYKPNIGASYAHTGSYGASFYGPSFAATAYQTIATATGQAYEYSVWVRNGTYTTQGTTYSGTAQISFGAVSFSTAGAPAEVWTRFLGTFVASDASTVVGIEGRGRFIDCYVDDVSVRAVPEPSAFAALGLGGLAVLRRRKR